MFKNGSVVGADCHWQQFDTKMPLTQQQEDSQITLLPQPHHFCFHDIQPIHPALYAVNAASLMQQPSLS
jgi:hypothetical protein